MPSWEQKPIPAAPAGKATGVGASCSFSADAAKLLGVTSCWIQSPSKQKQHWLVAAEHQRDSTILQTGRQHLPRIQRIQLQPLIVLSQALPVFRPESSLNSVEQAEMAVSVSCSTPKMALFFFPENKMAVFVSRKWQYL
jgi:hypothetical protein